MPCGQPPRGIVIIVHGFGEHSGRYDHVGRALAEQGLATFALDHQGHGASEGDRAYAKRFGDFCADVLQLTECAKALYPDVTPLFLIGHSMGGAIALKTALETPDIWTGGVVLSGPLLVPDPAVAKPALVALARGLSRMLPKLALDKLDPEKISKDPVVVSAYMNDPLVYTGGIRVRLAAEFLAFFDEVQARAADWSVPFLIQHGSEDTLCLPRGSVELFRRSATPSADKKLILYEGLRHEIYNSLLERDPKTLVNKPIRQAIAWMESRL